MSATTQQSKPETLKLGILAAVVLVALAAFGVHKYHANQEAAAQQARVFQYIDNDPAFQMILQRHKAAKKFMVVMLSKGIESKGDAGMEYEARKLQFMFSHFYMVDDNWYAKPEAIKAFLSNQYRVLSSLQNDKSKKKRAQCNNVLRDKIDYGQLVRVTDKQTAEAYADSLRDVILSAQDHQLTPLWPGADVYNEALQVTTNDLSAHLAKFDPQGYPALAQQAMGSHAKMDCKTALPIIYSMLMLPPDEMALVWRLSIEADAPAIKADRKKRTLE
jgi:hypothetical protein